MELKNILEENDFSLLVETTSNLGNTLTRVEIEGALVSAGHTLPLPHVVRFYLTDGIRVFIVMYAKNKDLYAYERYSVAN